MIIASIIIVTKNQKHFLEKTIPTLLNQKIKDQFEIIVVDSGSTDGAREYIEKINKIKLIKISPQGFKFANAFNTNAKEAKGKYLVRLSGDCVPQGDQWLSEIVKSFEDESVGGVFGKYILSGKKGYTYPNFWSASRFPKRKTRYSVKPYPFMGVGFFNLTPDRKVYEFAGGCCAVRKDIWEKRPFNERLLAGEDAEYSWFLHLIGYDVLYSPKIEVLHEHKIDPLGSVKAYSGLDKWSLVFSWEILRYWIGRVLGHDPYKGMYRT